MRDNPKPYEIWKHYEGGTYFIIAVARREYTGEELVIYKNVAKDDTIWATPLSEFMATEFTDSGSDAGLFRFRKDYTVG